MTFQSMAERSGMNFRFHMLSSNGDVFSSEAYTGRVPPPIPIYLNQVSENKMLDNWWNTKLTALLKTPLLKSGLIKTPLFKTAQLKTALFKTTRILKNSIMNG